MPEEVTFAAVCGEDGRIVEVVRDSAGLGIAAGGDPERAVDAENRDKYRGFLAEARSSKAAFGWPINVVADGRVRLLHFGAVCLDGRMAILAAGSQSGLVTLGQTIARDGASVPPALRRTLGEAVSRLERQVEKDAGLYDEQTRLNNELSAAERALVKANARLSEANAELNAFYEALPIGAFRVDAGGMVSQANATFRRLAGIEGEQAWHERVHEDDRDEVARAWQALIDARTTLDRVARFVGADGETRHLHVRVVPLDRDESRPLRSFVGVAEDVSARLQAERQAHELVGYRVIRDVTAGLAHNLNNILAVTLGTAEQLVADAPPGTPLHDGARLNLGASGRAAALTRHLMTYSGIAFLEAGRICVDEAVRRVVGGLETPHRDVVRVYPDAPEVALATDATAFTEALEAVLDNAFRALEGRDGGIVTVTTAVERAGPTRTDEVAAITVEDDGAGMDEETRQRATEPFFTTRDVGQGMGLGLSFADGFARLCGGSLAIESAPGRGTRVTLRLPVEQPED